MVAVKCGRCGETKDASEFYRNRARKNGLTWCCKQCGSEAGKLYRKEHKEELRSKFQAYRESHREHACLMTRKWKRDNPAFNAYCNRRARAKKRKVPWNLSREWYLDNIWDKRCFYGDHAAEGGIDRLDSKRGYDPDNCVPCCFVCNAIKGTQTLEQMYQRLAEMLAHRETVLCLLADHAEAEK